MRNFLLPSIAVLLLSSVAAKVTFKSDAKSGGEITSCPTTIYQSDMYQYVNYYITFSEPTRVSYQLCSYNGYSSGIITDSYGRYVGYDSTYYSCSSGSFNFPAGRFTVQLYSQATLSLSCSPVEPTYAGTLTCNQPSYLYTSGSSPKTVYDLFVQPGTNSIVLNTCNWGSYDVNLRLMREGQVVALGDGSLCSAGEMLRVDVVPGKYTVEFSLTSPYAYISFKLFCISDLCKATDHSRIGNKECDFVGGYNTAACGYDGGDCCVSSCANGYGCSNQDNHCRDGSYSNSCGSESRIFCALENIFG